jgi:RNA polymerase sigma factor (sigma-70 family)
MAGVDDRALWQRLRANDAVAFGTLFDRYADAVHRFCFRRTADWALADDLTSLVFLEAWRGRTRLHVEEGALPLLLGIATNVVRNHRRARRRHRAFLERLPVLEPERDFADDLAERIDAQREAQVLVQDLARLPRREQDVLALTAWAGLSPAETAAALGIPQATVRTRLHRARRRLAGSAGRADGMEPHSEGIAT